MGDVIHVDFATRSPKPAAPLWPEGVDPNNVLSFEAHKLAVQKSTSDENPGFTPMDLQKLEYFSALLDFPGQTSVTVNSHYAGVLLPSRFQNKTNLRLNWSYKSGITDFQFDQWGVRGGMSFGGEAFFVELPWPSVWQICKLDDPLSSLKIWPTEDPEEKSEED